ncbi:hypothetical protein [Streptomyces sp. bgisy029]|uniref:hypothetical protein n=1 Tax=Streptomyces sp. bgisy029 TaxID=3413771 RepID=UPI003D721A29
MPLPVVPDPAGPPPAGPAPGGGNAPLAGPPPLSVRVPPRPHAAASGTTGHPTSPAQALQRAAAQAGITGVPVKAVPPKSTNRSTHKGTQRGAQPGAPRPVQRAPEDGPSGFAPSAETPTGNATATVNTANEANTAARISGAEIEELARRLLDPVSRLIRADMRRGRERAGRLHDGRR